MTTELSSIGQGDIAFQERLYSDPNPTRRGLHTARRQWIEQRLRNSVKPGDRVLEVGIGCGIFTRFLKGLNANILAVDINQAFLDGVSDLAQVNVRNADATYDLGERDIDLALCSEVLEHVPPDRSQAMLNQFFASLKPGGLLILTTPQRFATVELMARLFKFAPVLWLARKIYGHAEELGHINLLTSIELHRQIQKAGFVFEEKDLLGFYLPGIAELGGQPGATILGILERVIKRIPVLRGLIWTQAYQLRKPATPV
jgi:2-polyprenyl-3-methyl-5-hydroxy-6-metoxy-1,4-benzoquinol methylase